ncbi:MAG TPA: UvrD-helicase domain-containing protein [Isosphaeraceae bacterium]|nr:UvrD-helicase domain-containing protein [Isosphaeraceae bacterium]
MDLLTDLTPAQKEAVCTLEGPMLILAGAGSGKTRVITRRVGYMLSRGIPGSNILALTFTNKAAGEMRHRIEAIARRSDVWVGTFHSLCARLLRHYAPLVGLDKSFTIYDQSDRLKVVKSVMQQKGLDELGVTPEKVESAISRAKNDMLSPEAYRRRHEGDHISAVVERVYAEYQERMLELAAVDFDDLLVHVVNLLKNRPDVRAALDDRFRYVLVDEYQDTNMAQYAIVRALSVDTPNLAVTGDPDQSIYGWRGANLNNILGFEKDYPGCKVVKLERNYRSTKNILKVADHLIRFNRQRKPKSLETENPDGAPIELTVYSTEADEAHGVASRILSLVQEGDYSYRDIAVFVRVTALTRTFEGALRAARIPYQVVGGVSFYERQEIKDVLAYLSLMVNPRDDVAFERVVNVPPRSLGKTSIDHLSARARALGIPLLEMCRKAENVPGLKDRAVKALRDFGLLLGELAALKEHSAEEVLRRLLNLSGYHDFLAKGKGQDEDRLANVDELVSAARQFDHEHPGASVVEFLEEISLASAVDRWKDESGAVTLMTLHAAKGLEFPVVFVVGLEQGLLPHSRASESESELEEERRLLFVGITRAEKELYLSHCRVREFRGQRAVAMPSLFLGELPEEPMTVRDYSEPSSGLPAWTPRRNPPAPSRRPMPGSLPGFRISTAADLAASGVGEAGLGSKDLASFQPGVTVVHPQYGIGRLVAVDGAGPNRKGRVAFTVGGERTFVLAQSPLRVLGGKRG